MLLTDQSQNQYLSIASETWERESKVVRLKWPRTTNMQNTWNRLWCCNCLTGLAELFPCCFLNYQRLQKQIQQTSTLIVNLLNSYFGETSKVFRTTDELWFIQTSILQKGKVEATLFNKWLSFYLLMFRLISASSVLFFTKHLWRNLKASTLEKTNWKC